MPLVQKSCTRMKAANINPKPYWGVDAAFSDVEAASKKMTPQEQRQKEHDQLMAAHIQQAAATAKAMGVMKPPEPIKTRNPWTQTLSLEEKIAMEKVAKESHGNRTSESVVPGTTDSKRQVDQIARKVT